MMSNEHDFNESDQSILEEIEVLKAILFSELDITYSPSGRPVELQTVLYPSTADDANQQYVCLTLVMNFPPGYPDQKPVINLRNPRGLGDDFLANAVKLCHDKCDQFSGSPVIYEIIELLRECLTNSNRPTGHCTICLFDFHPDDVFTYTTCYHHFHSHCLSRFCESLQRQWKEDDDQEAVANPSGANWKEKKPKQFSCPVCREEISVELAALKLAPPPQEAEHFQEEFRKDAKYVAWKAEMDEEYRRQKERGAIIDLELEDSRFLVVTESAAGTPASDLSSAPTESADSLQPQCQPLPVVQASAAPKTQNVNQKPDWYRAQGKPGRGKYIHRSEPHNKDRPAQHAPRNSNPVNRQHATEKHNPQPRHRAEGQHHPSGSRSNGAAPVAQCRPPPGFEPR